ncbi:hypothetical protein ANN_17669 [Periplaneta americana]|uniref:Protein RFT1 homolog n=1 Tax=Periplaneta americana TaxID=6978 RepID=A0ABQ8SUL5_PERAM|nr:hypothetical protein ANN_17669 [Periplaneta americana]
MDLREVGYDALGYSYSWSGMIVAALMLRLGTGGVTKAMSYVLKDTMGSSEAIKIHTLLHIFTGLLIMLGIMIMLQCRALASSIFFLHLLSSAIILHAEIPRKFLESAVTTS